MTDKAYLDANLPFPDRVRDLVSRMTTEEKVSQMMHDAPAIERLGVPAYNWWNECLHGVARAGVATVFPQAIGLAAMWDAGMMHTIATVTFPKSLDQLPPFEDYSMEGRTYRYMTEEPLYPFGYGLSYTSFDYFDLKISDLSTLSSSKGAQGADDVEITTRIRNTGARAGDEVVQLYLTDLEASTRTPIRSLVGFKRVSLKPGETKEVTFTITSDQMKLVNDLGERVLEPGAFRVEVGGWAGKPAVVGEFDLSNFGGQT